MPHVQLILSSGALSNLIFPLTLYFSGTNLLITLGHGLQGQNTTLNFLQVWGSVLAGG